ncbi:hypothetical protein Pelo_7727 [Pelomyxa schiedti]|nr:hypothetical protein Pelo_7727 [Pelomyxa schiedti]
MNVTCLSSSKDLVLVNGNFNSCTVTWHWCNRSPESLWYENCHTFQRTHFRDHKIMLLTTMGNISGSWHHHCSKLGHSGCCSPVGPGKAMVGVHKNGMQSMINTLPLLVLVSGPGFAPSTLGTDALFI